MQLSLLDKVPVSVGGGAAVHFQLKHHLSPNVSFISSRLCVSRKLCEIICWLGQDGGYSVFSSFLSMEYIRPLRLCRIVLTPQVSDCCLQIEQRVPCHRDEICQVSDLQYPHTPECPTLPNTQTLKKFGISLGLPCVSLCV